MLPLSILVVTAVAIRILGDFFRSHDLGWPFRIMGWLLASVAIWLAAAVFGAWTPIWPAILIGMCGGIAEPIRARTLARSTADVMIVLSCAILSIPRLGWIEAILGGTVIVIGATLIGQLSTRIKLPLRRRVAFGAFAVGVLAILPASWITMNMSPVNAWFVSSPTAILSVGITSAPEGERIELTGGAIAWLDRPRGMNRDAGAVFFHGNHRDGANQPAALAMRRALRAEGYTVLSVDHPGFGASPAPTAVHSIDAWDPLPAALHAIETLLEQPQVERVIAVGHSMGATDVLRLLTNDTPIKAAVLFGAGMRPPEQNVRRLHRAFHRERNLGFELSTEMTGQIFSRFYEPESMLSQVELSEVMTIFVAFDIEHDLVIARRDEMYEMLPTPKTRWDFERATHYVNTSSRFGIVVGDVRATARTAELFRALQGHLD